MFIVVTIIVFHLTIVTAIHSFVHF